MAIGVAYVVKSSGVLAGSQGPGECSHFSDRGIQHELTSLEHSSQLPPRLCALRRAPSREQTDHERSQQRTRQENTRNEQEAMNSNASGRTHNSWDVISEATNPRDPNSSLEAPSSTTFEVEASSHGVWGRIQMRLPAVFRGGREWLGKDEPEEVHYTTSQVTQAAMDEGTYDVTRPPILVTSDYALRRWTRRHKPSASSRMTGFWRGHHQQKHRR